MFRTLISTAILCAVCALGLARPTASPTYENLNSLLWFQTSVEYKAVTTQTYRAAQAALLQGLRDPHWTAALEQSENFETLPPAVILDLDETVLDNSAFEARETASGHPFSDEDFQKWIAEKAAGLVPGAMDFLQFAHANGVAPLYITNRTCDSANPDDPTLQMLRTLGVPLDSSRIFCAKDAKSTDKTERRKICALRYRILLLVGDQLGDFLQIPPAEANLAGREKLFAAHQSLYGERWFQLPNPTYGSWETATGETVAEKLTKLRK